MILAVDVGNSNIVYGGFCDGRVRFTARVATNSKRESDQYAVELAGILALNGCQAEPITGVAIASVVPTISHVLLGALGRFYSGRPFVLEPKNHVNGQYVGLSIAIDNPAELGADIFACALAAKAEYPLPAVIIDMGTATKMIGMDGEGRLQGVSISPGLFLSVNALFQGASLLQGLSLGKPARAVGKNSPESIKSGVVLGTASMLDGMIDRFEAELGPLQTVVATGGAASLVVPCCARDIRCCDTLVLEGLLHAYRAIGAASIEE